MKRRMLFAQLTVLVFISLLYLSLSSATAKERAQEDTLDLLPTGWNFSGAVAGYEHAGGVWVYNSGLAAAQDVAVRFYMGDPESGSPLGATQVITEIPAQQSRPALLTWMPQAAGVYTITAWIDPDNAIAEASEDNNRIGIPVDVREADLTWYVDQALAESGDGRTPETAFRTIQEASAVAVVGDAIQMAPGLYSTSVSLPKGIDLSGAGRDATVISGTVWLQEQNRLENVTVTAGSVVLQGAAIVRNSRIANAGSGITTYCSAGTDLVFTATVESTIIDNNRGQGIGGGDCAQWTIRNNTIVSNTWMGISVSNGGSLIENNIVARNGGQGISTVEGATIQHNLLWRNDSDIAGEDLLATNLLLDPMLRDIANGDYRLYAGSPAIGNGNPAGTDMGALPFEPSGTPPGNVTVTPLGDFQWQVEWTGNAAGYHLYLGTESGVYQQHVDAPHATRHVLSGLPGNVDYFVAVSSDDGAGGESRLSKESSFFVPPAPAGSYEEDSSALNLTGAWRTDADAQASGGRYLISDTPGDTLQLTFTGDSIALYRRIDTEGGQARVTIDGVYAGNLDFDFVERRWQVPSIFDNLGEGVHTFTLEVAGYGGNTSAGNVYIDTLAIPSPFQPTDAQRQAVDRVNYFREMAGIPTAQGVQAIHEGAQAHAEFVAINQDDPRMEGLGFHGEHADLPGFVGQWPSQRAQYFGYTGGVGEDGHFIGDPIGSVDGWMATVYHRDLIMCFGCIEVGYGMVNDERGRFDVLNMGSKTHTSAPVPQDRLIYTYPGDGQIGIPHLWGGGEIPDPLPDKPKPVGYPVSLYIQQPAQAAVQMRRSQEFPWMAPQAPSSNQWQVTVAELRDEEGQLVPGYLLEQHTDPNRGGPDVIFLIAHQPLALNTTYAVRMAGIDSQGAAFDHSWSFTTEVAATIYSEWVSVGACDARVSWSTAGETMSWLEYGATPAYGTILSAGDTPDRYHSVTLQNLQPGVTYHYRITSRDAQGNERSTGDRTFRTRSPQVLLVPVEYDSLQEALHTARACDTVQVAVGVYEDNLWVPFGVNLVGAGSETTIIQGNGEGTVISVGDQAQISGFTIRGSSSNFWDAGIWIADNASPTITNNRITGNAMGIVGYCFEEPCDSAPVIQNNVVDHNSEDGINLVHGAAATVVNNTVVGNQRGIHTNVQATTLLNNIVVHNTDFGLHANNLPIQNGYNDVWNNGTDYRDATMGEGDLSVDPFFVDAASGNYRLQPTSPLIDAGHPDAIYNDPDGTRNDVGADGGPGTGPNPSQVALTSEPAYPKGGDEVTLHIRLTNRGAPAQNVQLVVGIPNGATYVAGSAAPAQFAAVEDNQIRFTIGSMASGSPLGLSFKLQVHEGKQPMMLVAPVSVTWTGGNFTTSYMLLANGLLLHLPVVAR